MGPKCPKGFFFLFIWVAELLNYSRLVTRLPFFDPMYVHCLSCFLAMSTAFHRKKGDCALGSSLIIVPGRTQVVVYWRVSFAHACVPYWSLSPGLSLFRVQQVPLDMAACVASIAKATSPLCERPLALVTHSSSIAEFC